MVGADSCRRDGTAGLAYNTFNLIESPSMRAANASSINGVFLLPVNCAVVGCILRFAAVPPLIKVSTLLDGSRSQYIPQRHRPACTHDFNNHDSIAGLTINHATALVSIDLTSGESYPPLLRWVSTCWRNFGMTSRAINCMA
jgi:hypothetical protein